jgi:site-specific DNA-cytosine methylase
MKLSFVDLFCGAGGAGLGLKRASLDPLLGVDKYSRAVEVYREAVGPAIQADVRELDPLQVITERPFLLWASPPCPPWSQGRKWRGLPMGFETEDGLLLLEPLRWAEALRPRWVIVENVGTLPDEAAEVVASKLREMGYATRVLRLDARAWVPQSRDHAFVVGGPVRIPDPAPPLFAPRFADIADGEGARPVEPQALQHSMRKKYNVPIVEPDGVLPTVSTRAYHHRWTCFVYDGDGRYRFPTFREAARAQGFPDDHPLHRLAAETSTVAWRLLGDAVPVPMAEALGRAVLMAEEAMVNGAARHGRGADPGG